MAFEEALKQDSVSDTQLRGSVLVMRWLFLLAYVVLVEAGVLDVTDRALLITGGIILFYDILHLWLFFTNNRSPKVIFATRYIDLITITLPLIAVHDERNPIWAIYFISIVGAANTIGRREMVAYVAWSNINYVGAAAAIDVMGAAVSWPYVITVSVLLQFMGFGASILAGAQERLRQVMMEVAVTDSLTGLANRRRFHDTYVMSLEESIEKRLPLALMLIDVDHFKEINDTHGHPAGDDKLREVAQALKGVVRTTDLVARYGGDEFVIVAPGAPRDVALALAERLRTAAVECGASVSIGVALFPDDAAQQEALLEAADAALYKAKQAGRNCVRDALAAA